MRHKAGKGTREGSSEVSRRLQKRHHRRRQSSIAESTGDYWFTTFVVQKRSAGPSLSQVQNCRRPVKRFLTRSRSRNDKLARVVENI